MKSHRKTLTFHLQERMGFLNITPEVQQAVSESGVKEGLCLVNAILRHRVRLLRKVTE